MRMLFALLSISLLFATEIIAGDPIRLPVISDNSIVMVDGEWELNAGRQGRIRIKGNQHVVAMAFDTSAVAGKRVKTATLVCVQGDQTVSGISVSTIATPWNEQRSNGLTAGIDGFDNWGYSGARFPAASGGNGFTLVHQSNSEIRDGKYHWDVPPDMTTCETVIRHSMRLKACRDAQQLIEYLNLLQQQRGWSQDQMRRYVNQYVNLKAQVNKINEADAGTTAYDRLSASGLETLRMATSKLLEAK